MSNKPAQLQACPSGATPAQAKNWTVNEEFFYQQAGYSHKPPQTAEEGRIECAFALARAEANAKKAGVLFVWDTDPDTDSSDFSDEKPAWTLFQCAAMLGGRCIASRGAIDFGRHARNVVGRHARNVEARPYARVVQAELSIEGSDAIDTALRREALIAFGAKALEILEAHEEWDSDTTDAIAEAAREEGLVDENANPFERSALAKGTQKRSVTGNAS